MKYIFLLLAFTSFDVAAKVDCKAIRADAELIMQARQSGVTLARVMEIMEGESEFVHAMVLDAYAKAKFSSEQFQADAVNEFADNIYLKCLSAQMDRRLKAQGK